MMNLGISEIAIIKESSGQAEGANVGSYRDTPHS